MAPPEVIDLCSDQADKAPPPVLASDPRPCTERERSRREADHSPGERQRRRRSRSRSRRRSRDRLRSRSRSRRRRRKRSRSLSYEEYQRRREASRERQRFEREKQERDAREQRERDRADKEPTAIVIVQGIPETGVTEERLENVAWDVAVQAGSSMPNGVHFTYDEETQEFRGVAMVEFPHKEAAQMFKDHAKSVLEVDGVSLKLKYHHIISERSRSRSRDRFERRDEPSVTLIMKGMDSNTSEGAIAAALHPFATIKDIRHFPRRGFAFIQFHSKDDAAVALNRFQRECRSRVDGQTVVCHFASERKDDARFLGAERAFQKKQAMATEQATVELEKIAQQQVQEANTTQALSGVNADMWASYMQSFAQTETVQSSNTFKYDKDSGFYIDKKADLFYDPNTTYFFTTDYKKYFVYDHDEKMLCLVDAQGKKAPNGERRKLPSSGASQSAEVQRSVRDLPASRDRRIERALSRSPRGRAPRERSHSRARGRSRERVERDRVDRDRADRDRSRERGSQKRRPLKSADPLPDEGAFKPIYFPGGDPLAKLAPAPGTEPAAKPASQPKKKSKNPADTVLGLASLPDNRGEVKPGKVTMLSSAPRPGPVTILGQPSKQLIPQQPPPAVDMSGIASAVLLEAPRRNAISVNGGGLAGGLGGGLAAAGLSGSIGALGTGLAAGIGSPSASFQGGDSAAGVASVAPPPTVAAPPEGWICEVCMRKFNSEEMLRKHEALSDLHKQNLAKLAAAS